MKLSLVLLSSLTAASLAGQAAAATAPAPTFRYDAAKAQQIAAVCVACHTADGTRGAPANPILQGQHPEYIAKQLAEFKVAKRKNAIMQGMAAPLSDDDMKQVATFYAGKKAGNGAAKSKELVQLGEQIYRGGIATKLVPACAGCHSPNGAGIPAQYPRLQSQHGDYTEAQLTKFRSGERANSTQMMTIAAKLNDREIKAVSDYIAGLR